jgi:hypothetical protein
VRSKHPVGKPEQGLRGREPAGQRPTERTEYGESGAYAAQAGYE